MIDAKNSFTNQLAAGVEPIANCRFNKTLADVEREHIEFMLEVTCNNKNETARRLGIANKTLYNKLHELGLFEKWRCKKK